MKITAQWSMVIAAVFSSVCFAVAMKGFMALDEITDPAQLSDAKGFAMFWAFLGTVGLLTGIGSFVMMRSEKDD